MYTWSINVQCMWKKQISWKVMLRHVARRLQLSVLAGTRSVMNSSVSTSGSKERCINHVQLLGRVGVEPKVFGKDGNLVSFPLGTTLRYRANNADGSVSDRYRTSWHLLNVRIPRLRDYILDNVHKGTRLMANGRLEYTQSNREDGSVREYTIIVVDDVIILSQPRQTAQATDEHEEQQLGAHEEDEVVPRDSATIDSPRQ